VDDKFQTAFPEDVEPKEGEILCSYGCGRPAKYGDLRGGFGKGQPGDPPRCELYHGECPKVNRAAIRAAKQAGRLGRRWRSRF